MDVQNQLAILPKMSKAQLLNLWREHFNKIAPSQVRRELLVRILAYKIQEKAFGGLRNTTRRRLRQLADALEANPSAALPNVRRIKPGTRLIRQWQGKTHQVTVGEADYEYSGQRYASLSEIARLITGTRWSGPLFFGLKGNGSKQVESQ